MGGFLFHSSIATNADFEYHCAHYSENAQILPSNGVMIQKHMFYAFKLKKKVKRKEKTMHHLSASAASNKLAIRFPSKSREKRDEDNGANEITECYLKFLLLWYFHNLQRPRPREAILPLLSPRFTSFAALPCFPLMESLYSFTALTQFSPSR